MMLNSFLMQVSSCTQNTRPNLYYELRLFICLHAGRYLWHGYREEQLLREDIFHSWYQLYQCFWQVPGDFPDEHLLGHHDHVCRWQQDQLFGRVFLQWLQVLHEEVHQIVWAENLHEVRFQQRHLPHRVLRLHWRKWYISLICTAQSVFFLLLHERWVF